MTKPVYAALVPDHCEKCNNTLADWNTGTAYDSRTSDGRWGWLCPVCWADETGSRLGLGHAQRYTKQLDDRWLKTGG